MGKSKASRIGVSKIKPFESDGLKGAAEEASLKNKRLRDLLLGQRDVKEVTAGEAWGCDGQPDKPA